MTHVHQSEEAASEAYDMAYVIVAICREQHHVDVHVHMYMYIYVLLTLW